MVETENTCLIFNKTCQQIKYNINYPQGPQHTSTIIYFYYKGYQNIQVITLSLGLHAGIF